MALRTFHSNPSLGGFGNESTRLGLSTTSNKHENNADTNGDAFCQVIKEIVDNAVDACGSDGKTPKKRVRVVIEPVNNALLQVTVSDNGSGMADIAKCVDPFHTSKGGGGGNGSKKKSASKSSSSSSKQQQQQTTGRYGIGLTRK